MQVLLHPALERQPAVVARPEVKQHILLRDRLRVAQVAARRQVAVAEPERRPAVHPNGRMRLDHLLGRLLDRPLFRPRDADSHQDRQENPNALVRA